MNELEETLKQDVINEEQRDKERSSIDRLFKDIKDYTTGPEFLKKLQFYTQFPYLGAYNAALVAEQRPGARFVLTAREWKRRGRKIKHNARPVMILLPFYPVEFLFDVSDTDPIFESTYDNEIIEDIIHEHLSSCSFSPSYYWENLYNNMPKFGISHNTNYHVGALIQAETIASHSVHIRVRALKNFVVNYKSNFIISIDSKADQVEALALTFHELAHIFCHHINHNWWKDRLCTTEEKEFEAETVAFLVCRRLDIDYNPVKYLAGYVDVDCKIPDISLDSVFRAVDLIEQMSKEHMGINSCFLYKFDETFRQIVNEERERRNRNKKRQQSL